MRIVVIGDDPAARDAARRALEAQGYEVDEAPAGEARRFMLTGATREREPLIQTITPNGFELLPTDSHPADPSGSVRFRVTGKSEDRDVVVMISPEAVGRVLRLTGRALLRTGAYFRLHAERVLTAYLCANGRVPDAPLCVADVSPDDIDVARVWEGD